MCRGRKPRRSTPVCWNTSRIHIDTETWRTRHVQLVMDKFLKPILILCHENSDRVVEIRLDKIAIDEVDVTVSETRHSLNLRGISLVAKIEVSRLLADRK